MRVCELRRGAREPGGRKVSPDELADICLTPRRCAQAPAPNLYVGTLSGALALAHTAEEAADGRPAGPGAGVVYEARRLPAGSGLNCYFVLTR